MKNRIAKIVVGTFCFIAIICNSLLMPAAAEENDFPIEGKIFESDEKGNHAFSSENGYTSTTAGNTYGTFTIHGEVAESNGKYGVTSGNATFTYSYDNKLMTAADEEWHVIEEKKKSIDSLKTESNIGFGALILQSSKDGTIWHTDIELTNLFSDTPNNSQPFYETNSVQLANGTHFRVIVAYELGRKIGEKTIAFVKYEEYEYAKYTEVYEFYLYDVDSSKTTYDSKQILTLGSVKKTDSTGYAGDNTIDIKDPHYGWQLGKFFVSGYTRSTKDDNGTTVFLKNVGDQVALWFNLEQDINILNENENLSISSEADGYDQYFQTPKMETGRGMLIIRYTDEKGVKHDPEIYTNYLEACTTTSADTVVRLFEEGDYEVALDYEIKNAPRKVGSVEIIPEYSHYRIYFEFSVRNGNCMVYPFDIVTGAELTNEAITENGFRLDMARSRYLIIDVKMSVVVEGANGYTQDQRFNRPAKDGDSYTDDGIYEFSVKNLYTDETTTKTIYVGSQGYMRALSVNGFTVTELNSQIEQGGLIQDDGSILYPEPEPEVESESEAEASVNSEISIDESLVDDQSDTRSISMPTSEEQSEFGVENQEDNTTQGSHVIPIAIGSIGLIGIIVVILAIVVKRKNNS